MEITTTKNVKQSEKRDYLTNQIYSSLQRTNTNQVIQYD